MLALFVMCDRLENNRSKASFDYPLARKEKFDTAIFDVPIADEYFWMSRKVNVKEVRDFSQKQGKFAQHLLDSIPGTDLLNEELGNLFASMQHEVWAMTTAAGYIYYYRDVAGAGPTLCRRKSPESPEEQILSRVEINGQAYSVRKRVFAHRQPLLALMLVQQGEANPQIRIFDLTKQSFLPDSIAPVMFNDSRGVSMAWAPDDQSLFYTQSPPTNELAEKYFRGKIMQHIIGRDQANDSAVFGMGLNKDISLSPAETPYIYTFTNSDYLVTRIRSAEGENYAYAVHYSDVSGATTPWKRLKEYVNLGDAFDAQGKWMYAATTGAPHYRIVRIDMSTGELQDEFLPPQEDVIAGTDGSHNKAIIAAKDFLYVLMRKIGDMQIVKVDLKTKQVARLPLSGKSSLANLQLYHDNDLVFCQLSPLKMDVYQWYEHKSNSIHSFPFADQVLDKTNELTTKVIQVPARDGRQIPVSVVYNKTLAIRDTKAWLIEAYGNNASSRDLYFDPYVYPWIKQGGVYAYAHVRGGGELGAEWHQAGQFPTKMNSVNDVVDIADWLVKNQYSTPSKIMVMGASAGSILVGNAINQRPDLFAGGIFLVGLPDLATNTDAAGARDGNKSIGPKDTPEGFLSNYQHSAYYHIPEGKPLPAMLIIHGATDYILAMSPAARYVARLQERQKGERPILFLVNWEGGHSTISENEPLYILKFALWQTGHPDFQFQN